MAETDFTRTIKGKMARFLVGAITTQDPVLSRVYEAKAEDMRVLLLQQQEQAKRNAQLQS